MARIMVTEPRPPMRRLVEEMVHRLGHETLAAEAPTPAQLRSVDLLLLETADARESGLARTARVANPQVSIILLTGLLDSPAELASLGGEYAGYLPKPFGIQQLDVAIRRALAPGEDPAAVEDQARRRPQQRDRAA